MDLRNYGVIDFAEHVQLDGMWSAKNKALHEQVDLLNTTLQAVRAENGRYLAQHHDDQIEMNNLRVEIEQLKTTLDQTIKGREWLQGKTTLKAKQLRRKTERLAEIHRIRFETERLLEDVKFQGKSKQLAYQEVASIYFKSMQKIDKELEVEDVDEDKYNKPPPTPMHSDRKAPFAARAKTGIKHSRRTHDKRI